MSNRALGSMRTSHSGYSVAFQQTVHVKRSRHALVTRAGLFDFLTPKAPTVNPKAKEYVDELVTICSKTNAGSRADAGTKAKISQLVEDLQPLCMKNPLKSELLWGEYEVLYASKPSTVGGPLRSVAGTVVFPGQRAKQVLEKPNKLINIVDFKTLGFVPGYSRWFGEIKPISGDTFILSITNGEIQTGLSKVQKEAKIERKIRIAYLDETIRIAVFLPDETLEDEEAVEPNTEEILFVFQRVVEKAAAAEEEEDAPTESAPQSMSLRLFGGPPKEGLATQAERSVNRAMRARAGAAAAAAPPPTRQGTLQIAPPKSRPGPPAKEVDPRVAREKAAAEAQLLRAKAAEESKRAAEEKKKQELEARARAQAEKEAEREKQAAIRELLAELSSDLKEAQADASTADKELRDVERANVPLLRSISSARSELAASESAVEKLLKAVAEAQAAKKAADQQAQQFSNELREAEKKVKQLATK